ncbi:MAG: hypothetical protein J0L53_07195 [Spirochaetes bacterium]|nr:hypothetical protein [Spirochaetota bacterium]
MSLDLEGFEDALKKCVELPGRIHKQADKAVARGVKIVRGAVIKKIHSQPGNWPALDPKYAARKAKAGGSNKKLISGVRSKRGSHPSTNYVNSFTDKKIADAEYAIGSNHPQARALEFGYEKKNIKARPHLNPAVKESADAVRLDMVNTFKEILP